MCIKSVVLHMQCTFCEHVSISPFESEPLEAPWIASLSVAATSTDGVSPGDKQQLFPALDGLLSVWEVETVFFNRKLVDCFVCVF